MYVKIDCSKFASLVEEKKDSNPWSETNLYSNIAVSLFLGLDPSTIDITWPPRRICIKSTSPDSLYPELKERIGVKGYDYYILSVVDLKTKQIYLEGWLDYKTLSQEKNIFKDYYVVSYKDLYAMSDLNVSSN